MTTKQELISNRADEIQADMQRIIDIAKKEHPDSKAAYQDFTTAYLISRIAAIEIEMGK